MLFYYYKYLCNGYLLLSLIFFICAGYAYRVNARRPKDDSDKCNFHFGAIFLAPVTWPLFIVAYLAISMMRAVLFSVCLVLGIIGLLVIRKPFLFIWLDKIATKIGNRLLAANTSLIHVFFGRRIEESQT